MTTEVTKRYPYDNGAREAVFTRINHVTRFYTRTKLQRIQYTNVNVDDASFPGPPCLRHLSHGYWEAMTVQQVSTDGIWIVHASRGDFDVSVADTLLHFQSNDTLFGCPWHDYHPASRYAPGSTLTRIVIKPKSFTRAGRLVLGDWSRMSAADQQTLGKLIAAPSSHLLHRESGIDRLAMELIEAYERDDYGLEAMACAQIDRILIELVAAVRRGPVPKMVVPKKIRTLLARIEASVEHDWTREEMLEIAGRSPAVLTQWFRRAVGFSPMRYVTHLRIQRGRELLAGTDWSVTRIAHALGFPSSQRFATVFRQYVGVSPSEYRSKTVGRDQA